MAQSQFMLYKYIKLANGSWRYCKAAFYSNGKIRNQAQPLYGRPQGRRAKEIRFVAFGI
jgi:hypothetical protein